MLLGLGFLEFFQQLLLFGAVDCFLAALMQIEFQLAESHPCRVDILLKRLFVLSPQPHVIGGLLRLDFFGHMGFVNVEKPCYLLVLEVIGFLGLGKSCLSLLFKLLAIIEYFIEFKFELFCHGVSTPRRKWTGKSSIIRRC